MDSILYNKRLQAPIYTGSPWEQQKKVPGKRDVQEAGTSFSEVLKRQIENESKVEFSKHAMERVISRNVNISSTNIERLNEGVRMAEEKGLSEPLILVDSTAFVVNVKNNKVITVVNQDNLRGTVFTNIDGTVMM